MNEPEPMYWDEVVSYLKGAAKAAMDEQCGFIASGGTGREWIIPGAFMVFPIRNAHHTPSHNYLMNHTDQALAFDYMNRFKLNLWGAYHTHPSGRPVPSDEDIREWRYPPEFRMVIVTMDSVKAWRIDEDERGRMMTEEKVQ